MCGRCSQVGAHGGKGITKKGRTSRSGLLPLGSHLGSAAVAAGAAATRVPVAEELEVVDDDVVGAVLGHTEGDLSDETSWFAISNISNTLQNMRS